MADYYQPELDLRIKKENESTARDGLKIPSSPVEELRQRARLYSTGGGIHYGIPPEERSSTRWWRDATH